MRAKEWRGRGSGIAVEAGAQNTVCAELERETEGQRTAWLAWLSPAHPLRLPSSYTTSSPSSFFSSSSNNSSTPHMPNVLVHVCRLAVKALPIQAARTRRHPPLWHSSPCTCSFAAGARRCPVRRSPCTGSLCAGARRASASALRHAVRSPRLSLCVCGSAPPCCSCSL